MKVEVIAQQLLFYLHILAHEVEFIAQGYSQLARDVEVGSDESGKLLQFVCFLLFGVHNLIVEHIKHSGARCGCVRFPASVS